MVLPFPPLPMQKCNMPNAWRHFTHADRAAPPASSLRDAEWRQLCRHSALRHSSLLLPQSLCGRLSSSASVRRGAGPAHVRMGDLCHANMSSRVVRCTHVCMCACACLCVCVWGGGGYGWVCGWTCSSDDVLFERGSLLCPSWHVWLWQSPHPTSCCHMLSGFYLCCARATSPQTIVARWIWSADGACFSSA